MKPEEFEEVWDRMQTLFPAYFRAHTFPAVQKNKRAWCAALAPYSAKETVSALLNYTRKSKYLPDISDITSILTQNPNEADKYSPPIAYFRRIAYEVSNIYEPAYRAAGILPWREAKKSGEKWEDWLQSCRIAFSTPERKSCFPKEFLK